jgi:hypothetical protein
MCVILIYKVFYTRIYVCRKLKQMSTTEHMLTYVICRAFQKLCVVTQYKTLIVRAVRNAGSRNH